MKVINVFNVAFNVNNALFHQINALNANIL